MLRFDYRQSVVERIFGERLGIRIAAGMRAPFAAVGGAVVLLVALSLVETHRLAALDAELGGLRGRIALDAPVLAAIEGRRRSLARVRTLRVEVVRAHNDALVAASTIARLGNDLPPQTWLTNIDATQPERWSISGRSTSIGEIGSTLARLAALAHAHAAHFVSMTRARPEAHAVDFVLQWDRP